METNGRTHRCFGGRLHVKQASIYLGYAELLILVLDMAAAVIRLLLGQTPLFITHVAVILVYGMVIFGLMYGIKKQKCELLLPHLILQIILIFLLAYALIRRTMFLVSDHMDELLLDGLLFTLYLALFMWQLYLLTVVYDTYDYLHMQEQYPALLQTMKENQEVEKSDFNSKFKENMPIQQGSNALVNSMKQVF